MTSDADLSFDGGEGRLVLNWILRLSFAGAAGLLVGIGILHLADGRALEAAFPGTIYIRMNHALPAQTYASEAKSLQQASSRDGDALLLAGEALADGGGGIHGALAVLRKGLTLSPASARGWTLLAEDLEYSDRRSAAAALSLSLAIAPRDYWVLGRNLVAAGILWNDLPDDARQAAVSAAGNLWSEEDLRRFIRPLLAMPAGARMMTESLRDDPERMRALNRWLAGQTLDEKSTRLPIAQTPQRP